MGYLRKPFEGEAGMAPLLRGEQPELEQAFLAGKSFECFLK